MAPEATRPDPGPAQPAPATRPGRVLDALRHFSNAENGLVCQTTGTLAHLLGVSSETIRRGIADLLRLGSIERTGLRRGKAIQYRIVESQQLPVRSPQARGALPAATGQTPTAAPLRGGAVGRVSRGDDDHSQMGPSAYRGSPMLDEDREHLDNFEWTPELRSDYAARARALALRYSGGSELVAEFEDLGAAECGECQAEAPWRSRYGKVDVCRPCLARRHAVAERLARFPEPRVEHGAKP
jgi:hypothetical protein